MLKSERISPFWVGGYRPFSAVGKNNRTFQCKMKTNFQICESYNQDVLNIYNDMNIKKLYDTIKVHLNNLEHLNLLGEGVQGYAYDCGNDLVLKVTVNINEYRTAKKLKGQQLDGIIKIYDCFEITDVEDTYYCIFEEKLDTQNIDIADFISEFRHAWVLHKYNNKTINEAYRNKSEMINVVRNSISEKHINTYDYFSKILMDLLEKIPSCDSIGESVPL